MAWTLIESTESGWKKYETESGGYRYQKPNGKFANSNQWGGGTSHSKIIDETEDIGGVSISRKPTLKDFRKKSSDFPSYTRAYDYILTEPHTDVNIPLEIPNEIDIYEYGILADKKRIQHLIDISSKMYNKGYTHTSIGFKVETRDEMGNTISQSVLQSKLFREGNERLMKTEFKERISMAQENADEYYEMIVLESRVIVREQTL